MKDSDGPSFRAGNEVKSSLTPMPGPGATGAIRRIGSPGVCTVLTSTGTVSRSEPGGALLLILFWAENKAGKSRKKDAAWSDDAVLIWPDI